MNQVILLSTEKMSDLDYQPKINRGIRFLSKRNEDYCDDDGDYRIETRHTYSLSTIDTLTSSGWWVSKKCVLELRNRGVS